MFKRTNKMWKGIAVALAVCMLPTVAFAADSINTITVGADWVTYDAAENTVTVTGTIGADGVGNSDADVTILAVRSAEALTTLEDVEDIQAQAVYIDQESFENGAFTFSFIPRKNVSGKVITVFVGGENVQTLEIDDVEAPLAAGSLTLKDNCKDLVDNNGVTLVYDVVDSAGWADILVDTAKLMNGTDEVTGITKELSTDKKTFTVTVPALAGETASYTLEVKHADYADATATGTAVVTAPTVKDVAKVTAPVATKDGHYTDADGYNADDPNADQKWAKYFITPSAAVLENGSSISWTLTDATGAEVDATEGTYELKRYADKSMTYTLVGEVTNGTYVKKTTEPFTFPVGQLGVAGVDVVINPASALQHADAAKLATITLKKGDAVVATAAYADGFKLTAVAADTYTVEVTRPGYVKATAEVIVTADGLPANFELPTMVAGDTDGDGKIHANDYMAIVNAWRNLESNLGDAFPDNCDINGDGYVHAADYMAVVNNWRYGM